MTGHGDRFCRLPDDFVSVLNMSWFWPATVHFYSSQGITSVTGPRALFQRVQAAIALNTRFKELADLRNWDESSFSVTSYVQQLRSLGFGIKFTRHEDNDESNDDSVDRFFRAAGFALPLAAIIRPIQCGSLSPAFRRLLQRGV